MTTHGGKRPGAGRPASPDSKSIPRAIRVTRQVDDYLREVGSGIVETLIRKSKGFKDWEKNNG